MPYEYTRQDLVYARVVTISDMQLVGTSLLGNLLVTYITYDIFENRENLFGTRVSNTSETFRYCTRIFLEKSVFIVYFKSRHHRTRMSSLDNSLMKTVF